jgi:hypothetical protein
VIILFARIAAAAYMPPASTSMREHSTVSVTPRYAPIQVWCATSGMSRSGTYEALGRRDLKAIKLGARTLIDVEAGLAWLGSMPSANITTGQSRGRRRGAATGRMAR